VNPRARRIRRLRRKERRVPPCDRRVRGTHGSVVYAAGRTAFGPAATPLALLLLGVAS
jgi:hypothetical protein